VAGLFDKQSGGLVTFWKSKTAITDLVGAASSAKIWPNRAPEGSALPYIVYTRGTGGIVHQYLGGYSGARQSIVHVYCYGATNTAADALCEAVKQNTRDGNMRGTWAGVYVNWVYIDEPPDDEVDDPVDKSDTKKYWTRLVLRIVHSES
jgi:hypothetical protein